MKITSMALMVWTAGTAAGQPRQKLTVYVQADNLPGAVWIPAEALASKMFARIGISLDWHREAPAGASSERPILIEFKTRAPDNFKPGALAHAQLFEGRHITVFVDRIENNAAQSTVLAHEMVHEITHLLQGVDRHSATGVMKAHWSLRDFRDMRSSPLPFTSHDVDLIYDGLAKRDETLALAGALVRFQRVV